MWKTLSLLLSLVVAPAFADEPAPVPRPDSGYRVGPGDVLQVRVYGESGLTGGFPVGEAGNLDFPLIGPIQVSGMTAADVAILLRDQLGDGFIVEPNVSVWLDSYNSQPVQVLGAVAKPGMYYLKGSTTLLQLLGEAGGVKSAGIREIRVTRGKDGGSLTLIPYEQLIDAGSGNIELMGGDVVMVPESLVSVMGSVGKPGEVAYREQLTVSMAIAAAGGAAPTANLGRVFILRGDARIRVNVRKVLSGKLPDVAVEPGDRIFVKESAF